MTTSQDSHNGRTIPRILVVDDMPDNLFLMNGLFEDRYRVLLAPSGAEALKIIMSDEPPDMVLLDIMMPDMDGYEVLRRIRTNPPTASIPVIFLTALASRQDERLGRELGAIDYLTKPVDPEQVIRRVEEHVRNTQYARRLDDLSEKLARHLTPRAWQRLFHGADLDSVRFEERPATVLYAETTLLPNWGQRDRDSFAAETEALVARHGGQIDPFVWGAVVAWFDDPHAAVRTAMDLQRTAIQLQLRIGVHTGDTTVGLFSSDGLAHRTLIGAAPALAARTAASAATGSVVIAPETYVLVHQDIQAETRGCLVTEELFQDTDFAQACITPAPMHGMSDVSTFAGLGLH